MIYNNFTSIYFFEQVETILNDHSIPYTKIILKLFRARTCKNRKLSQKAKSKRNFSKRIDQNKYKWRTVQPEQEKKLSEKKFHRSGNETQVRNRANKGLIDSGASYRTK